MTDPSSHPPREGRHAHRHFLRGREKGQRRLGACVAITLATMAVEFAAGILAGSLALVGDAGHMLTHGFSLIVSYFAVAVARRPATDRRTFGLYRVEILAALFNGATLLVITGFIVWFAVKRLIDPVPVAGGWMLAVAVVGLGVNVATALILRESAHDNLNVRSAFVHMLGDLFSSVVVIGGALVIILTGWNWIDPLLSVLVCVLILSWAYRLVRQSVEILLQSYRPALARGGEQFSPPTKRPSGMPRPRAGRRASLPRHDAGCRADAGSGRDHPRPPPVTRPSRERHDAHPRAPRAFRPFELSARLAEVPPRAPREFRLSAAGDPAGSFAFLARAGLARLLDGLAEHDAPQPLVPAPPVAVPPCRSEPPGEHRLRGGQPLPDRRELVHRLPGRILVPRLHRRPSLLRRGPSPPLTILVAETGKKFQSISKILHRREFGMPPRPVRAIRVEAAGMHANAAGSRREKAGRELYGDPRDSCGYRLNGAHE